MRQVSIAPTLILSCLGCLCCLGCLGPMDEDHPGYSPHILPPDGDVPAAAEDEGLRSRIEREDGIEGDVVSLRSAWAEGEEVRYWDFGPAPSFAIPLWAFRHCNPRGEPLPAEAGRTDHLSLVDAVPGDPGYSPFWSIYTVCVTDEWNGELITSAEALRDAEAVGLVEPPSPTGVWVNCPVVPADVRLEVGGGAEPISPREGYYKGRRATWVFVGGAGGAFLLPGSDHVIEEDNVYFLLRPEEGAPLDVVFAGRRRQGEMAAPGYTPLRRVVEVVVTDEYATGDLRAEADIVRAQGDELVPVDPRIASVTVTDRVLNLEVQFEEGRP